MKKENIIEMFKAFLEDYDYEKKDAIWIQQSEEFKTFWQNKIISGKKDELNDQEIDEIVKYLDKHAKGASKKIESVARAMIPQGAWRRMFNQFHSDKKLSEVMTKLMEENDLGKRATYIDQLFKENEGNKNSLTGKSGTGVNDFLVIFNPLTNLSIISLNDRKKLIEFLKIPDFIYDENQSIGKRCVATNKAIFDYFYSIGLKYSARTISVFCYSSDFQPLWKTDKNKLQQNPIIPEEEDESSDEQMLFHMEKQLETFLIENWDKQN